jgi:hypothetical protein
VGARANRETDIPRRPAGYARRRGWTGVMSSRRWAILADLAMRGLAISFLTATRVALVVSFLAFFRVME